MAKPRCGTGRRRGLGVGSASRDESQAGQGAGTEDCTASDFSRHVRTPYVGYGGAFM